MGKITATLFALCVGIGATGLFAGHARAATLLVDGTGQLTGARNVDVGGALFDVDFVDGTCTALFGNCDEASDFAFTTQPDATVAAQALLDQVFLDGVLGNFDTSPDLTLGCPFVNCSILIPFSVTDLVTLTMVEIQNNPSDPDFVGLDVFNPFTDTTTTLPDAVFARFSPVSDVPEPASMLLFGAGLLGLTGIRRRRR